MLSRQRKKCRLSQSDFNLSIHYADETKSGFKYDELKLFITAINTY